MSSFTPKCTFSTPKPGHPTVTFVPSSWPTSFWIHSDRQTPQYTNSQISQSSQSAQIPGPEIHLTQASNSTSHWSSYYGNMELIEIVTETRKSTKKAQFDDDTLFLVKPKIYEAHPKANGPRKMKLVFEPRYQFKMAGPSVEPTELVFEVAIRRTGGKGLEEGGMTDPGRDEVIYTYELRLPIDGKKKE